MSVHVAKLISCQQLRLAIGVLLVLSLLDSRDYTVNAWITATVPRRTDASVRTAKFVSPWNDRTTAMSRLHPSQATFNRRSQPIHQQQLQSTSSSSSTDKSTPSPKNTVLTTAIQKSLATQASKKFAQDSLRRSLKEFFTGGWSVRDIFFGGATVLSISLSTVVLVTTKAARKNLLVRLVCWLCVFLGVTSSILQRRLSLFETMRELTNQLRDEVNSLSRSNSRLEEDNLRLEEGIQKLQAAESALKTMTTTQGYSVDELVKQVEAYQTIQSKVRRDLKSQIKQTMLSVFIRSDKNQDYRIGNDDELDTLVMRLMALPSIELNELALRTEMKKNGGSITAFFNNNLQEDEQMDKIFKLKEMNGKL